MRNIDLPDHLMLSTGKAIKSVIELVKLLESQQSYASELLALLYGQDLEVWLRRINEESKAGQVKEIRLIMNRPDEALAELIKVLGEYASGDDTVLIKAIQNTQPGAVKHGIYVGGQVQPDLEGNSWQNNKLIDIYDNRGFIHTKRYKDIFLSKIYV